VRNKFYKLSLYIFKLGLWPALRIVWKMFKGKVNEKIALTVPGIRHPVFIRAQTSDEYTFQQIFINEEYAFEYEGTANSIIDAGSNIGLAAVYFANRFPHAKIICLEPEPENFKLLLQNIKPYPSVTALQQGLWSRKSHLRVEVEGKDNWGFTVSECDADEKGSVSATSIPDLMREYGLSGIDIAKIDIEGSELQVLMHEDSGAWIKACNKLIIELHDRMKPGTSRALFEQLLKLKTFRTEISGENLVFDQLT
jgi:FkbM family methyltransferase